MYVGRRNGMGTLNQTAGTISVNREFGVGTRDGDQGGIGTYVLSGGALAAAGNIFIGKDESSSINATSLVRGVAYVITTPGDTVWTAFGAADNDTGTVFTASASGIEASGSGIATKVTDVSGNSSRHHDDERRNHDRQWQADHRRKRSERLPCPKRRHHECAK